jgi:CARDB protein
LSFLDEPETRTSRSGGQRRRPPPRGPGTDRQTLLVRRGFAVGAAILVLVLLIFVIKGCRDSAREQAFKDYLRNVASLMDQSNSESRSLFGLLAQPGTKTPVQLQTDVNTYRNESQTLVDRANRLEPPDELKTGDRYLLDTLELRRDGLTAVASELPTALGDANTDAASARIAAAMQEFLASDVIYNQRALPNLKGPTEKQGLTEQVTFQQSRFLLDLGWLSPTTVADRMSRIRSGVGSTGTVTPGPHGTGLGTVSVKPGGQTLASGSAVQLKAAPNLSFDVQVTDQGASDEKNVRVRLTIEGAGKPIVVTQTIPSIAAGQTATASIPLATAPPTGLPVTIKVEVLPVTGEKNTTNNRAQYSAVFTK